MCISKSAFYRCFLVDKAMFCSLVLHNIYKMKLQNCNVAYVQLEPPKSSCCIAVVGL